MLRKLLSGLIDTVYPKVCLACKSRLGESSVDSLVCPKCWNSIKRNLPPFCHSCGRHIEKPHFNKNLCPSCLKSRLHFDRAFSPCVYEGVIKDLIHEFKYKNKDYLGPTLSRLLIEFIKEYNLPLEYLDSIISVPLHKARLREREFNQADILSRHIGREFKKEVLPDALRRLRYTRTQTDLDVDKRLLNVRESFAVTEENAVRGRNILLIDDVLTSGATSSEAARALKDAGANIVFVLTLAN